MVDSSRTVEVVAAAEATEESVIKAVGGIGTKSVDETSMMLVDVLGSGEMVTRDTTVEKISPSGIGVSACPPKVKKPKANVRIDASFIVTTVFLQTGERSCHQTQPNASNGGVINENDGRWMSVEV